MLNSFISDLQMNHPEEHPAVTDLREMEVLRFLFDLKREQIDPMKLQQMLLEHQIQNQVKQMALLQQEREKLNASSRRSSSQYDRNSPSSSSSLTSLFNSGSETSTPSRVNNCMIPEPKIIFNYVESPKFPTPTSTPEPDELPDDMKPIDYTKASKKQENFQINDRCEFIKLKDAPKNKAPPTPASSSPDSDSDQENLFNNSQLSKLVAASKIKNWCGSSIYNNLPELVMTEYDKMLRDSHNLKVEVVKALNTEFPVSYDYNPKKSRIRTNYNDPRIADDRTRNNIASRRSRQRKKFQVQMIQYSVDYDLDENFLLSKQEKWLKGIISNLEQKILTNGDDSAVAKLRKLRIQCGFE